VTDDLLLALPLCIPLIGAAVGIAAWARSRVQQIVGVVSAIGLLAAAGVLLARVVQDGPVAMQVGTWPYPAGIALEADVFSAVMVVVTAVVTVAGAVYGLADLDVVRSRSGAYPLLLVMVLGVTGAFLTRDLFNLYVWFEVMLIASFVLLALGGARSQLRAALLYVSINLLGSALFLSGAGLVYQATRTLDMRQILERMGSLSDSDPFLVLTAQAMLLVAFGIKAGVFPLFFWLPASYPAPPATISAVFAGLLTKVGVYAMIRVTLQGFPANDLVFGGLGVVAALTMLVGVLGALAQSTTRGILSFHIVSQIGYMVAGLAMVGLVEPSARASALAAAVFYIVHHILVKTNLFFVAGIVLRAAGTERLDRLGGLATTLPFVAASFLVSALSLAGIPPLSGMWAKLAIIDAGLRGGAWGLAGVALVTGLLTLMSMTKIWTQAFWGPPREEPPERPGALLLAPSAALALGTLAIGLQPQPLLDLSHTAAEQLLDAPTQVVGEAP